MSGREKQFDIMSSRGYRLYQLDTYIKTISFTNDPLTFPIYAEIKDDKVQLSSAPLGHAGVISMPYVSLSHPGFDAFEDRLARYVSACMRADAYASYKPPLHDEIEEHFKSKTWDDMHPLGK